MGWTSRLATRRLLPVWTDPVRRYRTLLSFAETEEDGGRDLAAAARRISDPDLRRILTAQPLAKMQSFAALLGWKGLRLECVLLDDAEASRANVPHGVVIYYMTTDDKFHIQINTYPHGQVRLHQATVKAQLDAAAKEADGLLAQSAG